MGVVTVRTLLSAAKAPEARAETRAASATANSASERNMVRPLKASGGRAAAREQAPRRGYVTAVARMRTPNGALPRPGSAVGCPRCEGRSDSPAFSFLSGRHLVRNELCERKWRLG